MNLIIKICSLFFGVVIGVGIFSFVILNKIQTLDNKKEVRINNQIIIAEVVKTDRARELGLSGRKSIGINEGMLFEYVGNEQVTFWMKNMKFPIDIVWIHDGVVIGFEENVDPQIGVPEDMLNRYSSPGPITQVLELQNGRVKTLGLFVGAQIIIKSLVR